MASSSGTVGGSWDLGPRHVKAKSEIQEEFKKKLPDLISEELAAAPPVVPVRLLIPG